MHGIESPADFGQCQCVRESKVATLPARLKLLLKLEKRLALTEIAETVRQEFNATIQEGCIIAIGIS